MDAPLVGLVDDDRRVLPQGNVLAHLPQEHAVEGNKLGVVYMNEQYPVTVARVGSQPLFDPTDERMKTDPS